MSKDKSLRKLEKKVDRLARKQEALCRRLDALDPANAPAAEEADSARAETIEFLDQFRAGEALGEASLGAWIAVCQDDSLRGNLRTIQMREGMHARLLEDRLKELGATPNAETPEALFQAAMTASASVETSDCEKLAAFMARFPDIDAALAPIVEMADRLDDDPETQGLLRTICQDERSTLECLTQACERLSA